MNNKILKQADEYFTKKVLEYGNTNKGVDWNSKESQELRFQQLSKIIAEKNNRFSICDYGCGYGAYCDYVTNNGFDLDYTGIDISSQMIENAKALYPDKKFLNCAEIDEEYDYIIASGIFNLKQSVPDSEWRQYIIDTINMFNEKSKKGFAFNCLTKYSDAELMREDLYYSDPLFLFDYAKKHFSRNVALLHDYNLYEFTILVRK